MRFALRRLLRSKSTTAISVALLGLGIGASTAAVSVAHGYVFTPLFPGQERLFVFWPELANGNRIEISYPEFLDWQGEVEGFSDLAVMWSATLKRVVRGDGPPSVLRFRWVSASFFETLGVSPRAGRTFAPSDTEPGAPCAAVLSFGFWRSRFGGNDSVLGRDLEGEERCTVIGVMPPGFGFPDGVDAWMALRREGDVMNRDLGVLWGVGRVAEGVAPEAARVELDEINRRHDEENFDATMPSVVKIRPIGEEYLGAATSPALMSLLAGVGLLYLIACANVAGLGVTRALARTDEFFIQRALGASRVRLAGELTAESALVAAAGALLGVGLAAALVALLPSLKPPGLPNVERVTLSLPILAFSVAAGCVAAILPGLAAATASFRREGRGSLRDGLVVFEIALAMVLLTSAGLCLRSFVALQKVNLGYETENVLSAVLVHEPSRYPELEDRRRFVSTAVERLRALPGVSSTAAILARPFEFQSGGWTSYLLLEGESVEGDAFTRNPDVNFEAVTPDYFRTTGIRLLEGRDFTERDVDDAPRVAIVSRSLGERLWPGESAVGQRLLASFGSRTFDDDGAPRFQTVVGVVEDARYRGVLRPYFDLYVPYRQSNPQPNQVVVRTTVPPDALAPVLRRELAELDPEIAVDGIATLGALVERELHPWRFGAQLFSFLGATAAVLAILGLFGLLTLSVRERVRELGIRAALGSSPGRLLRAVASKGIALCALGVPVGIAGSLAMAPALESLLYRVDPTDVPTFIGVAATLLMASLLASLVPARQASRISPAEALRHE